MADTASHDQLLQLHRRVDSHDGRLRLLETQQAVSVSQIDHISASLDKIHAGQTWLIRLVIGGLVAGVIAFLIQGGFNVG